MVEQVKKHVFKFKTSKGTLELATNDANDVANTTWFQRFMGSPVTEAIPANIPQSDWEGMARAQDKQITQLKEELVASMKENVELKGPLQNAVQEVRAQFTEMAEVQEVQMIDEAEVKELGKELEQAQPGVAGALQQQSQQSQQQPLQDAPVAPGSVAPGVRPIVPIQQSNSMNVTSDQMTQVIWTGMSKEQQEAWMKQHNTHQ